MHDKFNMSLLDSELSKLKAIGLKEISKSTKLASGKIEDVLEKRFDKLDRVRAKGFIAILEREYDVDLRDWILAQQSFMMNKEDISSVSQVISKQESKKPESTLGTKQAETKEQPKPVSMESSTESAPAKSVSESPQSPLDSKTPPQAIATSAPKAPSATPAEAHGHRVLDLALKNQPRTKSKHEGYTWMYVLLVLVLLALMGYFAYKAFLQDYDENPKAAATSADKGNGYDGLFFDATKNQSAHSQALKPSTPDSEQADSKPSAESPSQEASNAQASSTLNTHPEQNFFFNPQADSKQSPKEEQTANQGAQNQAAPSQTAPNQVSPNQAAEAAQNKPAPSRAQASDNVLHISSELDLWIGVIHLDTGLKEQFAYKKGYDIPLSGKMLFVMGHSSFDLELNGQSVPHSNKRPVRMYYDGESLVDVGYTKFKQLNGGAEW